MKRYIFILVTIIALSLNSQAQQHIALDIAMQSGFVQFNRSEPYAYQDRNKYSFEYGPKIGIELQVPKTKLAIAAKLQYSINYIPIFVGGEPWFRRGDGFRKFYFNNDHLNIGLQAKYRFHTKNKLSFGALWGFNMGVPILRKNNTGVAEGEQFLLRDDFLFRLDYFIVRSNWRNSFSLDTGFYIDYQVAEYLVLNLSGQYRLGLRQTIAIDYYGRIYVNDAVYGVYDSFFTSFSNTSFTLSAGLKWYLW